MSPTSRNVPFVSEEKVLAQLQRLLEAGEYAGNIVPYLDGFDSDRAWKMRKELINAFVKHIKAVNDRDGSDPIYGQNLTNWTREMKKEFFDSMAEGLIGLDSDRAWEMREKILDIGAEGVRAAKILADPRALGFAELMRYRLMGSVAVGLSGVDSERAWQMREMFISADERLVYPDGDLTLGCPMYVDKGYIAKGLAGLDSERAWEMRKELIDAGAASDRVIKGLTGLDSDRAWEMRDEDTYAGDEIAVAMSVTGLDSERAWQVREKFLGAARAFWKEFRPETVGPDGDDEADHYYQLTSEVANSLAGLDSERALEMKKTILEFTIIEKSELYVRLQREIYGNETRKIFPRSYVVYDLETTGLDPMKDEAIEIGALLVKDGENPILNKWLLKPSIPIPPEITNITGITQDDVDRFGRDPDECWREFVKFTGIDQSVPLYPLVGHNIICYDNIITQRAIKKIGLSLANVKFIDTAAMYKGNKMGVSRKDDESHESYAKRILETRIFGLKYKLELVYCELGGLMDDIKAHNAGGDVQMTNFVYQKLAGLT